MSAQMHHTPYDLTRKQGHGKVIEVLVSKAMKEVRDDWVLAHMLHVMLYWNTVAVHVHVHCMWFKRVCNTFTCNLLT